MAFSVLAAHDLLRSSAEATGLPQHLAEGDPTIVQVGPECCILVTAAGHPLPAQLSELVREQLSAAQMRAIVVLGGTAVSERVTDSALAEVCANQLVLSRRVLYCRLLLKALTQGGAQGVTDASQQRQVDVDSLGRVCSIRVDFPGATHTDPILRVPSLPNAGERGVSGLKRLMSRAAMAPLEQEIKSA